MSALRVSVRHYHCSKRVPPIPLQRGVSDERKTATPGMPVVAVVYSGRLSQASPLA